MSRCCRQILELQCWSRRGASNPPQQRPSHLRQPQHSMNLTIEPWTPPPKKRERGVPPPVFRPSLVSTLAESQVAHRRRLGAHRGRSAVGTARCGGIPRGALPAGGCGVAKGAASATDLPVVGTGKCAILSRELNRFVGGVPFCLKQSTVTVTSLLEPGVLSEFAKCFPGSQIDYFVRCFRRFCSAVVGGQDCIRREGASEAAPEAVRQAVGGGCRSGWGRLLSVTSAIEAGTCREGDSGWA